MSDNFILITSTVIGTTEFSFFLKEAGGVIRPDRARLTG
jgi:hypothetical protein